MSRPTMPPAHGTEFAGSVKTEDREADVTVELRMAPPPGPADAGFVVEWQLLPLADRREPAKRRAEKQSVRLVELGWQG